MITVIQLSNFKMKKEMKNEFLKIGLRQGAIYVPNDNLNASVKTMHPTTATLLANANKLGFTFSEELLVALNSVTPNYKLEILETIKEVTGVNKNWTPLVKNWDIPTGESVYDHIVTFLANIFGNAKGKALPCGHTIPNNTFELERYNGCPFCGTPFEFEKLELLGQGSKYKVLELWSDQEMNSFYKDLSQSKTALDATQVESLKVLLKHKELPTHVTVAMKETLMLVIDVLVAENKSDTAQKLFKTPADILRYLWYKHTGFLQIIEPKTILKRTQANNTHIWEPLSQGVKAKVLEKATLKLKYNRVECARVANWLNNLDLDIEFACETMHPKRGMWIRFIRALRLAEFAKKEGFDYLKDLLDVFYNEAYDVFQGKVDSYRLKYDAEKTFNLLKQRPGLFARSLFANMLWFGSNPTINAFYEIIDKVPARLLFTLNMYAANYFDPNISRSVKTLGGTQKRIPANRMLGLYNANELELMKSQIEELCWEAMKQRFYKIPTTNKTIYIEEILYKMPVAIGDRSESVQDLPVALMGTRFKVEGNQVRLFMQWGTGLPAQHLDMDLSCHIAYEHNSDICSFSRLTTGGCQHSGDIRSIPNKVGTAEYIDINLSDLRRLGVKYVTFTCNAYSNGGITPNLVVGWMNSTHKMTISERNGVAYDPSCVQHQVRITQGLTKGLVFGVLDVANSEIIWLEIPFGGQIVQGLDCKGVQALLAKLNSKLSIGNLLALKAEAQGLTIVDTVNADEVYDYKWGINAAAVTQLFID